MDCKKDSSNLVENLVENLGENLIENLFINLARIFLCLDFVLLLDPRKCLRNL